MPSHLCVQGVAGVGKSVFALTVALHLIQMNAIDGLVWLESPPAKPHELQTQIAHHLNFADLTPDANLEITLHSGRVLIVLDQADAWLNRAFLATQPWLRSARLMLISSVKAQVPVHMGYVNLPPLDREAALQAMLAEFHIPDEQLERFVSLFNAAFDDAQGNLKLLRKIIVEATRAQDDGHWLSPRLAGQDNSVITRKNLGKRLQTILTIFATGSWKRSIVSPSK